MSESKHTPGPWMNEYCGKDTIKVFKISDKRRIATIKVKTPTMDEANARLIAAAPVLLDACKELHDDLEVCPPELSFNIWCIRRLEAAIKEAEKGG